MPILEVNDYDDGPTFDVDLREPTPPPPVAPGPPVLSAAGRVVRPRITPARYRDMIPDFPSTGIQADKDSSEPTTSRETEEETALLVYRSGRNKFGLSNVYRRLKNGIATLSSTYQPKPPTTIPESNPYAPFPNETSFRVGRWYWGGSPLISFDRFVRLKNMLCSEWFQIKDLAKMNLDSVRKQLIKGSSNDSPDKWKQSTLKIPVPLGNLSPKAPKSAEFKIDQFHHRSLVGVIRSVFESPASAGFCYEPYEARYKSPYGGEDMAAYGEMYWSKAFRDAHDEVQRLPRKSDDNLPRAVVAMQLWSDGMAAAKFGTAKLWPVYLQFGNQSKYQRSKHNSGACHQVAHIPSVSICLVQSFLLFFSTTLAP